MAMETETCLRQALGERVKPVMCINQLDQVSLSGARLARAHTILCALTCASAILCALTCGTGSTMPAWACVCKSHCVLPLGAHTCPCAQTHKRGHADLFFELQLDWEMLNYRFLFFGEQGFLELQLDLEMFYTNFSRQVCIARMCRTCCGCRHETTTHLLAHTYKRYSHAHAHRSSWSTTSWTRIATILWVTSKCIRGRAA